jgi:hypothetical protein
MKANFKLLERVRLINLPTKCDIHGKTGFIAGKSVTHAEFDSYIVWLDVPTDTHMAVSITEACLEPEPVISGRSAAYIG